MKNILFLVFLLLSLCTNAQTKLHEASANNNGPLHFPYPVIFIHGLHSDSDTWLTLKNQLDAQEWTDGGILRFNLNGDNNLNTANISSNNQTEVLDFNTNVLAGDYYRIDFDCDANGNPHTALSDASQSNQAAIHKQGLAVKKAISHVLAATGREKVILVGHSMGGLAARQYLQNPVLWVSPGKHKVAKVVTIGTPHGGSNATGLAIAQLFGSADESSEAIRDLRTFYWYSGSPGVFLFGGGENASTLDDWADFYNLDVNCNGTTGNAVTGLNQKPIDSKVDFSCVIGDYVISPFYDGYGDLFVGAFEAQVKNYTQGLTSESFYVTALHSEVQTLIPTIYQSMDEPDDYERSYGIQINTLYNAFFSEQAIDGMYSIDYDDFRFTITSPGSVSISAGFSQNPPPVCGISILKDNGTAQPTFLFDQTFQASQVNTASISLTPGDYFLEFYNENPAANAWGMPYAFMLNQTVDTDEALTHAPALQVIGHPIGNTLQLQIDHVHDAGLSIVDQTGRVLLRQSNVQPGIVQLNAADWPSGIYYATLQTRDSIIIKKVLK